MKYLLEADHFTSPESSEEKTLPEGATIFRGRCYIEVDAESRPAAFAAAKAANINGVKEWGILAEGQGDIDKVKPHLSTNAIYSALIRSARLAIGLTQKQLGEQLGYAGETPSATSTIGKQAAGWSRAIKSKNSPNCSIWTRCSCSDAQPPHCGQTEIRWIENAESVGFRCFGPFHRNGERPCRSESGRQVKKVSRIKGF